jgi:hypothetical protein
VIGNAITAILNHDTATVSFDAAYTAARALPIGSDLSTKLKQEIARRLTSADVSSLESVVGLWQTFQVEVHQIQSFWKYIGLASLENQKSRMSQSQFAERRRHHINGCVRLSADTWRSAVHVRVLQLLASEIDRLLITAVRGGAIDGRLVDYLKMMGEDFFEPAIRVFAGGLAALPADAGECERLRYIVDTTEKLSFVVPCDSLQLHTIAPYLDGLVVPLLSRGELEPLVRLKGLLSGPVAAKNSSLVANHFAGGAIPDNLFGIAAVLTDASLLLANDQPVRRQIANKIGREEFRFSERFSTTVYEHFDDPARLRALGDLVALFGDVSAELARGLLLRLLQKRHMTTDKEEQFTEMLGRFLPHDQLRPMKSVLADYRASGNLVVMNVTLSMPLLANDSVAFPDDLIGRAESELVEFRRRFTNRVFRLSATFSLAYVKATWAGAEEKLLVVSVLQYRLLRMIEMGERDFGKLNATYNALSTALKFLAKGGIICRAGDAFAIARTPPKDRRINVYNAAINFRGAAREKAHGDQHDHKMSIQSVIAKVVKAKRRVMESELEGTVIQDLADKFTVKGTQVKEVVEHMIGLDFVERDGADTRYLLYVP